MSTLPIKHARQHFGAPLSNVVANGYYKLCADQAGFQLPPLEAVALVPPISVRVYRGQWIVDCPDCGGAEFLWLDELIMMCFSCFNGRVGSKWRPVALPKDFAGISATLRARAIPSTRNWFPYESLADLAAENLEHGEAPWASE